MPAIATALLNGAKTELAALYPAITVIPRKEPVFREPDPEKAFYLAIADGEVVDDLFLNTVLVDYFLTVRYALTNVPTGWEELPDVRDKREAIRKRFLKNAPTWTPAFNDIVIDPKGPYEKSTDKYRTYSTLTFRIQTIETREG